MNQLVYDNDYGKQVKLNLIEFRFVNDSQDSNPRGQTEKKLHKTIVPTLGW